MSIFPRVLYVDDEVGNCEMMKYYLESELPVKVITEPDGHGAMDRIGKEFFDVYILDYGLPDTTGIELCKAIRKIENDAKVIIYSALDRPVDKRRALSAGADKYFVKPDDIEELKGVVTEYLKMKTPSGERDLTPGKQVELKQGTPLERSNRSGSMRARRKCSGIT